MITDPKYIEQGFSEEALQSLYYRSSIEDIFESLNEQVSTDQEDIIEESNDTIKPQEKPLMDQIFDEFHLKRDNDTTDILAEMFNDILPAQKFNIVREDIKDYYPVIDNPLIHLAALESYTFNRIDNEYKIQNYLSKELLDESVLLEATNGKEIIKNKWEVFKNFILRIFDRFKDALGEILDKNKRFLERYKNNIINTEGSDQVNIEYWGNYPEAIKRCMNTELPVFNYQRDAEWLRQDGYSGILKDIMAGKNQFNYVEGENLGDQFKNWFLGVGPEGKPTKKTLKDLNFKQMYDFCYNSGHIVNGIEKDIRHLDQSSREMMNAANKLERENAEKTQTNQTNNPEKPTSTADQTQQKTTEQKPAEQTGGVETKTNESALYWVNINEADDQNANNDNTANADANKEEGPPKTGSGLKMDQVKDNGETGDAKKANQVVKGSNEDIKNIVNKWIEINRYFLTAKMTVLQTITNDYMQLIRRHLESQGVIKNKENKEGNKENNKGEEGNKQQEENPPKENNNKQEEKK